MNLVLANVNREYVAGSHKTLALKGVNINLHPGDQVMVVGASGSGKSTLLNIIGLLDRGYVGDYFIKGENARDYDSKEMARMRNKTFGYIFQEYALLESETVYENVKVPLLYSPLKRKQYRGYVEESLVQVGLLALAKKKVKHLSGGERQRVAIARALVNKPQVVLADEPTGSLDSKNRERVLEIIYDFLDSTKILIFVTHDLENNRNGKQIIAQLSQGTLELS